MESYFCFQHNTKDAPVLLWLQGGPGGSSLFGLFNENGPFQVTEDLKGETKLIGRKKEGFEKYFENKILLIKSFKKNQNFF